MPKETNANREAAQPAETETGAALARAAPNETDSDAMLAAHAAGLAHKAIEMAHKGNVAALQLSLNAALASEQRRASRFHLPAPLGTLEGLAANAEAVVGAFSRGELKFKKAARIQAMLAAHRKFVLPADKSGNAAEDSEVSGTAEDFREPMRSLEKVTGFKSKALEELKRPVSPDIKE